MLRGHDVCYAPLISSYGSVTATLHEVEEEDETSSSSSSSSPPSSSAESETFVEVWVTFLSPDLLQRMHETEACYDLQRLDCPAGGGRRGKEEEENIDNDGGRRSKEKKLLLALGTCADSAARGEEPAAFLRSALCYTHQAGSLLLPLRHVSAAIRNHGGSRSEEGKEGGTRGEKNEKATPTTATSEHDKRTLVALSEVRALNRRLPALSQRGAQAAVAAALAGEGHDPLLLLAESSEAERVIPQLDVEAWVARNLLDEEARRAAVALLVGKAAKEFRSPAATRLEQLGSVFGRSVD